MPSETTVQRRPVDDYQRRKAERVAAFARIHGVKSVQCVACNGSGRYDHNGSPPCGACGGTGKVQER
jgi:DnaJ-class molecular chaperone